MKRTKRQGEQESSVMGLPEKFMWLSGAGTLDLVSSGPEPSAGGSAGRGRRNAGLPVSQPAPQCLTGGQNQSEGTTFSKLY